MTGILEKVRSGLKGRNEVIRTLYQDRSISGKVYNYIISNGGTRDDADSLRTDAIVAFIKRCYNEHFNLQNNVEAYILKIVKNNWIREKNLEKKAREHRSEELRDSIESDFFKKENLKVLQRVMKELDKKCKDVMLMWAQNMRMREIAVRMNYKSEGMARKKNLNVCRG